MIGLLAILAAQAGASAAGVPIAGAPGTGAASAPPAACGAARFGAFDFWVGNWDVYRAGTETLVAHSRIERLYGGCAIRENWMPLKGSGGGSLSSLDPATGHWHQTWIGSQPGRVEFVGGPVGKSMVLTGYWAGSGPKGEDALTRMTYAPLADGGVRQHGEASTDEGLTWVTTFDLVYREHRDGPSS